MQSMNAIERAKTERASRVVFKLKKDGTLRFCIDYRKLNAVAIRVSYLSPSMEKCINSPGDTQLVTALDWNSDYCGIEGDPSNHEKTAFTSHHVLYQFTHLSVGLKIPPSPFSLL